MLEAALGSEAATAAARHRSKRSMRNRVISEAHPEGEFHMDPASAAGGKRVLYDEVF